MKMYIVKLDITLWLRDKAVLQSDLFHPEVYTAFDESQANLISNLISLYGKLD